MSHRSPAPLHQGGKITAPRTYPTLADIRRIVQEIRDTPPIRPLLTRKQAKEVLGVSLRYLDSLIEDGDLPVVRLGRAVRIKPDDLDAFIQSRTEHPSWPYPPDSAK